MAPAHGKRASRACDRCRRLKERCNGSAPCTRCQKSGCECLFTKDVKRRGRPRKANNRFVGSELPVDPIFFFDVERIRALERVVLFFTGVDYLSKENLQDVLDSLPNETDEPSPERPLHPLENENTQVASPTITDSENFSHSEFSQRLQQTVAARLEESSTIMSSSVSTISTEASPLSQLLSNNVVIVDVVSSFPSLDTALSLISIFFEFGQMNYFYLDEDSLRSQLIDFFDYSLPLTTQEAPWVCTTLMAFAIGAQFAHLKNTNRSPNQDSRVEDVFLDDALALSYYRQASRLIPDILVLATPESVQALLLLGFYVLPLDDAGLSSTYFSIALKIATQNGMHLNDLTKYTAREVEVRKRIWWTTFMLDRRISVFHGKHITIMRSNLPTLMPFASVEVTNCGRVDTLQNTTAMVHLTNMLEDARDAIFGIWDAEASRRSEKTQRALEIRDQLFAYWQDLPDETVCKDLTPDKPLFRHNVHLALTYHSVHIFIGRSFILHRLYNKPREPNKLTKSEADLVESCIQSAVASIELCQKLEDEVRLSRSSYIEFTCCHAAVSALVAESISSKTCQWKSVTKQGLGLLRTMLVGIFSRTGERKALEILEMAVEQLLDNHDRETAEISSGNQYEAFLKWVEFEHHVPNRMMLSTMRCEGVTPVAGVPSPSRWDVEGLLNSSTESHS